MAISRQDLQIALAPHWVEGWQHSIDCGDGWLDLIDRLHDELTAVDAQYSLFQVKEKFGMLRVHCKPSSPKNAKIFGNLIDRYERMSTMVCEITGMDGTLMRRAGLYKTLNIHFLNEGWVLVK